MRIIVLILLCAMHCLPLLAQQQLDTIYANEKKVVALFFPEPIRQGIVGKGHFVFNYNREKTQHFGLLQATPGAESNLLAITNDGKVYAYILKYAATLSTLNYFIKPTGSIGNERPQIMGRTLPVVDNKDHGNRGAYFEKFSSNLLKLKPERLAVKRKRGIKLILERMVYEASEVYLVITVENRSGIDFEVDYLNICTVNGNNNRKASYQKLSRNVVYKHNIPLQVNDKRVRRFVLVLPKFVLGDTERLEVELRELKGHRNIVIRSKP